ncbi:MAG TPA: AraC family transcriptional regulator [Acidimicrobiales bacterium]|nr:AraC family transcriptional regulator [Acidimicrobiales bacterium]
MVRSARDDARGLVAPDAGLQRFRLDRFPPSAAVGRLVDRYWVVSWDLRGRPPHTQHVFAHPVVNVTFQDGGPGLVTGVSTTLSARTLSGTGRVLGVMFRPAGFRPLLRRPLSTIRDAALPWSSVVGDAAAGDLAAAVAAARDGEAMAAAADAALAPLVPPLAPGSCAWERTAALVEQIAADPAFLTVEDVAGHVGATTRQVQRRFADHVGLGPKAVIRRYRLFEAAERARGGGRVDWAAVAASLGYSDQAHLTRDFTTSFGLPPGRYLAANAAGFRSGSARRRPPAPGP